MSKIDIKQIHTEIAKEMLNVSKLPERSLCTTLESVYIIDQDLICDGVYKLADREMGEPSVYGKVYQACCNKKCDFVAKWQGYIKAGDKQKNKENVLKEVNLQISASKVGIAPKIKEVWECDKGIIIIMEALKITASRDLKMLSQSQLDSIIENYVKLFKHIIPSLGQKSQYLTNFLNKPEDMLSYDEIVKARREINKYYYPKRLDETIIDIDDTPEEKQKKKKIIKELINLLIILYENNISHGDTHLNNYMRDMDGNYKLIDFGEAEENPTIKDLVRDLKRTRRDLIKLIDEDGYNNLRYLVDYYDQLLQTKSISL